MKRVELSESGTSAASVTVGLGAEGRKLTEDSVMPCSGRVCSPFQVKAECLLFFKHLLREKNKTAIGWLLFSVGNSAALGSAEEQGWIDVLSAGGRISHLLC